MKAKLSILSSMLLIGFLAVQGCTARYDIAMQQGGGARIGLSASLSASARRLAANLSALAQDKGSGELQLLDAASVSQSLRTAGSVSSVTLTNASDGSLNGSFSVVDLAALFSDVEDGELPLTLDPGPAGGSLSFSLSRDNAAALLSLAAPELVDWLVAIFAPIATGEALGVEEHLSLVASVYGDTFASELRSSRVTISVRTPGPVGSVTGGSASGSTATFVVPVESLLTLERPLEYKVSWSVH